MRLLLSCPDGKGSEWQLWREFEWYWIKRPRMSQYPADSLASTDAMKKSIMYRFLLIGPILSINSSQARWEEFATLAIQKLAFERVEL